MAEAPGADDKPFDKEIAQLPLKKLPFLEEPSLPQLLRPLWPLLLVWESLEERRAWICTARLVEVWVVLKPILCTKKAPAKVPILSMRRKWAASNLY